MSTEIVKQENGRHPPVTMDWTPDQEKLIKDTVCAGATDDEFKLFLYSCQRTGLDPLAKQVYAVKRWNSQLRRESMTIQTGIDGYRVIADRSGGYAGTSEAKLSYREGGDLDSATVTVYRLVGGERAGFTATAYWDEYVVTLKSGEPNHIWKKRPRGQLTKCAEALALRMAFPQDLSGLYTTEEMAQADNPAPPEEQTGEQIAESPQPEHPIEPNKDDRIAEIVKLEEEVGKDNWELVGLARTGAKLKDVDKLKNNTIDSPKKEPGVGGLKSYHAALKAMVHFQEQDPAYLVQKIRDGENKCLELGLFNSPKHMINARVRNLKTTELTVSIPKDKLVVHLGYLSAKIIQAKEEDAA